MLLLCPAAVASPSPVGDQVPQIIKGASFLSRVQEDVIAAKAFYHITSIDEDRSALVLPICVAFFYRCGNSEKREMKANKYKIIGERQEHKERPADWRNDREPSAACARAEWGFSSPIPGHRQGELRSRTAPRFTSSWNWPRSTLMPCPNRLGMESIAFPFFSPPAYGWPLYPRVIS